MSSETVFFLVKVVLSGLIIAAVSSLAKSFPKGAALLTAMPLMTFLSLIWIYVENKDLALLEKYTWDVMIWVIPSFVFFIAAYFLFKGRVPFVVTLGLSTAALGIGVWVFEKVGVLK
jgi:uncharacterized membrane protein (GlpM family)